jgi:hypothetical protein
MRVVGQVVKFLRADPLGLVVDYVEKLLRVGTEQDGVLSSRLLDDAG